MFESKSQPDNHAQLKGSCCYEYLKNNVWKQITTNKDWVKYGEELLRISKEQCLKANHNLTPQDKKVVKVVTNI